MELEKAKKVVDFFETVTMLENDLGVNLKTLETIPVSKRLQNANEVLFAKYNADLFNMRNETLRAIYTQRPSGYLRVCPENIKIAWEMCDTWYKKLLVYNYYEASPVGLLECYIGRELYLTETRNKYSYDCNICFEDGVNFNTLAFIDAEKILSDTMNPEDIEIDVSEIIETITKKIHL